MLSSWKNLPVLQQPNYNKTELKIVAEQIEKLDPVVDKDGVDSLLNELARVQNGDALILQIGDCAETFADFSVKNVQKYAHFFVETAADIEESIGKEVIVIGRIAGQFAKPRSDDFETIDGLTLPGYRGHIANDIGFNEKARFCNANRLMKAYKQSKKTVDTINDYSPTPVFVSHECLVIDYDAALVREFDDKFYCLSAHLLWIGYRTAQIDNAHIDFLSKIENPIGIKVGENTNITELIQIITKLNPLNKAGKIILIARFGANKIDDFLPNLIKNIKLNVIWICDPMHGNTYKIDNKHKTRNITDITCEIKKFINIFDKNIGGLHLEATPYQVTECVSDVDKIKENNYKTNCDPRLNGKQTKNIIKEFCKSLV